MMTALFMLTGMTSSTPSVALTPASRMAVLEAAQTCAGITANPQAVRQRLTAWQRVSSRLRSTDGQTYEHNHVFVTTTFSSNHPRRNACMVEARADGWTSESLAEALQSGLHARRQDALGRVIFHLADREILVMTSKPKGDEQDIVLSLTWVRAT